MFSVLILIGFMLILDGFHFGIPKGYIYFALFFSVMVEIINMKVKKKVLSGNKFQYLEVFVENTVEEIGIL